MSCRWRKSSLNKERRLLREFVEKIEKITIDKIEGMPVEYFID